MAQVRVSGAPTSDIARRLGKAVVNSPLFKSAIAGNDPNVGRLLAVVGRFMAIESPGADVSKTRREALGQIDNTFVRLFLFLHHGVVWYI